jgi:hypothetical protein
MAILLLVFEGVARCLHRMPSRRWRNGATLALLAFASLTSAWSFRRCLASSWGSFPEHVAMGRYLARVVDPDTWVWVSERVDDPYLLKIHLIRTDAGQDGSSRVEPIDFEDPDRLAKIRRVCRVYKRAIFVFQREKEPIPPDFADLQCAGSLLNHGYQVVDGDRQLSAELAVYPPVKRGVVPDEGAGDGSDGEARQR